MRNRRRTVSAGGVAAVLLSALLAGCATTGDRPAGLIDPGPPPAPVTLERPPSLVVEAILTDRNGVPAQDLRIGDFEVTVDGRRRAGLALGRLFRGPGADFAAATRSPGGPGEVLPLSEQSRVVVIVIDQASFSPGDERAARAAAESLVGLLGLSDRVAVVLLPPRAGTATIDFERADVARKLASLRPMWGLQARPAEADAAAADAGLAADAGAARGDEAARASTAGPGTAGGARATGEAPAGAGEAAGSETISPALLRAHAATTVPALGRIVRALASAPGAKTLLFFSSGLVADPGTGGANVSPVAADAATAHVRIFPVQVPSTSPLRVLGQRDLSQLATVTGGRLVRLGARVPQDMARLAGELSFSYLLMLAPMPGDGDPTLHDVRVALRRRTDLILEAPRLVPPWRVPPDLMAAALSPRARAEATNAAAAFGGRAEKEKPGDAGTPLAGFALFPHDHGVDLVLARLSQYALDYGRALSSLVSEETYTQEVRGDAGPAVAADGKETDAARRRTLVSDYLLVRIPGVAGWLPFRDVFAVDGTQVRDREDRLVKLFLEAPSPAAAAERASQVLRESARYNIGPVTRTLNVPTLPVYFLEPDNVGRFAFRKVDEATMAGRKLWVLEYTESARPTLVKGTAGNDVPVLGRVWVDPVNGRICQTRISALSATITVTYTPHPEIQGLWLPASMEEHYPAGPSDIRATATYSKYRQFQVLTSEQVTLPTK